MNRIIYSGTLLKSEAEVGTSRTIWNNVEGVLPPSETTSENPSDYTFILNGVEYVCNDFLHGTTKFKASFKMDGHDTIALEYIIETGLSNIIIRHTDVEVLDSNSLSLIENIPSPIEKAIINFGNGKSYLLDSEGNVSEV